MEVTQLLRARVLDLAVRGKLVPQDPHDEPVSELLEEILAERKKLFSEGKLKKKDLVSSHIYRDADGHYYERVGKKNPVCIDNDIPFEIPESWRWVRLSSVASTQLGKTMDKGKDSGVAKPYLCSINVYTHGLDLNHVKKALLTESEIQKYRVLPGDLLVCEGGDIGRSAVWNLPQEMYYQNALHRIRFNASVSPYYFNLIFNAYKLTGRLDAISKGVTIKHLTQGAVSSLVFPLPPLAEQRRIVDIVDKAFESIRDIEASVAILDGYKQSLRAALLEEAIRGRLVEQRAEEGRASDLLPEIEKERKRLYEEGKLKKKDLIMSRIFKGDDGHFFERVGKKAPLCIDDQIPFDIPDSWRWVRLGQIVSFLSVEKEESKHIDDDAWVLGQEDIAKNTGELLQKRTMKDVQSKSTRNVFRRGDVLYGKLRPLLNKVIVADEDGYCSTEIVPLTPPRWVESRYLHLLLLSNSFVRYADRESYGSKMPRVSAYSCSRFLFPLPPLAEQRRIVERLDQLMAEVEKL